MTTPQPPPVQPPRIDAHQHVWRIDRGDYFWIAPNSPINRDYGLDDLRPCLGHVSGTVLVQAAPTQAETVFILEAAALSNGLVQGVVGWTDLAAPSAPERVAALAATTIVKGVRPMLGFIGETDWILRAEVGRGLAAMANSGLRLDIPARIRHLPLLPKLADRHHNLAMVIDHAAKPAIACDEFSPWALAMAHVARETPMFCKISGLVTEAGENWQPDDLRPYIDHLLECFGPRRLMWGSDWPVVDLAGGYVRWWEATLQLIPQDCLDAVLGDTAIRFYGLKSPTHQ